jgi:N-methylhydantoinase B
MRSGGGGGYGSPLERPVEDVARDAKQGYIALEAVKRLYGVVLDPDTFEVDRAATDRLRASLRMASHDREAGREARG